MIVGQIRLPRVLLAAVMGAILAISGAAMQGLFRNPLADPSLIGVTAGASLGAALVIVLGGNLLQGYTGLTLVSAGAFAGGAIAVLFVYRLATSPSGTSVATMLLAGIAITALAGALGSLLEFLADNDMLRRISLWKMGGLDGANYPRLLLATLVGTALLLVLPRYAGTLNALLLGESEARHLGIDVDRAKIALITWVAIGVGTSVALVGTIAFVGLVVPHIVRMLVGPDHRYCCPPPPWPARSCWWWPTPCRASCWHRPSCRWVSSRRLSAYPFSSPCCASATTTGCRRERAATGAGQRRALGRQPLLDDINLALEPGQILGLAGPNGAGKSCLLRLIAGDIPLSGGRLLLGGQDPRATGHGGNWPGAWPTCHNCPCSIFPTPSRKWSPWAGCPTTQACD